MSPENGSQERSYPERIEWSGELRYKLYHHSTDRPFIASTIKNIGCHGVCFISSVEIPVDSILIIKLYQHQDYSPTKVLAKVRHCDAAPEHEGYAIDCQYHDLTPSEQMSVDEVVEEVCFIRRIHSKVCESLNGSTPLKKVATNGHKKAHAKRTRRKTKKSHRTT